MPEQNIEQRLKQVLQSTESITDEWLDSQRNSLMGAIDYYETNTHSIRKFFHSLLDQDYSWAPQMLTAGAMVALGILIGTRLTPPPVNGNISLEELFASGRIETVELCPTDGADNQFKFSLVTQNEMEIRSEEADQKTAQLVYYKLTNTPNSGNRLEFAKQISQLDINNELTLTAIGRVLLDEPNVAIQMTLLESISSKKNSIVRDVLMSLVMGDYPDAVRLQAIKGFAQYNDDDYVIQMLKIIAATDRNPSVQYAAEELLGKMNSVECGIIR